MMGDRHQIGISSMSTEPTKTAVNFHNIGMIVTGFADEPMNVNRKQQVERQICM